MKVSVKFWKNWNGSFGARIEVLSVENSITDFPTSYIFRNNVVDNDYYLEEDNSESKSAVVDYQALQTVNDWVKETMRDIRTMVIDYRNLQVPEKFVVEI